METATRIQEGNIQIELWSGASLDTLIAPTNDDEEFLALANELGFRQQPIVLKGGIPYPQLSKDDDDIWRAFLPTSYDELVWHRYDFDLIPLRVLREIKHIKQMGYFSDLFIRTPEKPQRGRLNYIDPLLVGYDQRRNVYAIARWGESLKPFEEIKREVLSRQPPKSWGILARIFGGR